MKKSIPITLILMSTLPLIAHAQEQANVEAGVTLNTALSIDNVTGLSFGSLQFQPNATGGVITLNTDSSGSVGGSDYVQAGSFQAGSFDLTMQAGESVSISCPAQATVALDGDASQTLTLDNIKYSTGAGDTICNPALALMLISLNNDPVSFSIGADLSVLDGAQAVSGSYSTAHAGGAPISFTISYD